MVRGLVRRGLLPRSGGTQSAGSIRRIAASLARRVLAALHEGFALFGALEHPSRIPVRGLWFPRRPRRLGLARRNTPERAHELAWGRDAECRCQSLMERLSD